MLKIHTLTLGSYQTNCYIVHEENSKTCAVIDPGYDPERILDAASKLGLTIDDIEANTAYQNSGLAVYYLAVTITGKELRKYKTHDEIISALGSLEYVNHIEEI